MSEQESFWSAGSFAVITDKTKPAMELTIDKLTSMGKRVYVVDISGNSEEGTFHKVSELPVGIDYAVIGITKTDPAEVVSDLKGIGIKKCWIHWRTDTPGVKSRCDW